MTHTWLPAKRKSHSQLLKIRLPLVSTVLMLWICNVFGSVVIIMIIASALGISVEIPEADQPLDPRIPERQSLPKSRDR